MQEKSSVSLFSLAVLSTIILITLQVGGAINFAIWVLFLPVILILGFILVLLIVAGLLSLLV